MGFLSNLVRNRALIGNLSREPMAQRIDPISTNPFGNFPIMPLPVAPQPIDDPIGPAPVPRPIPAPVLPPVFDESIFASPISPAPISIMGQPLSGADLELARSSGRGGLKGAFDNFQKFIAQNPDKTRQGGGFLGSRVKTPIAPPAIDRPILQRPIIPPRRDDFMSIERIGEPRDEFIPSMPNEEPIPFVPPVIPQTPISPPVNIGGPALDTSLIPEREILQRPIIPPRRDDFISIGGPGGGLPDRVVTTPTSYDSSTFS